MKKLLLTSSGLTTPALREAFGQLLPKRPTECVVAFVQSAAATPDDWQRVQHRLDELGSVGVQTVIVDRSEQDTSALRAKLDGVDAIFVNGGSTLSLLEWARSTGFDQITTKLVEQGVPYIGVSAGSYLACPTLEMKGWKRSSPKYEAAAKRPALNLVPFFLVVHYDESVVTAIVAGAATTPLPVIALRDGQAIQMVGDQVSFVGDGEPVAFNGFAEQYLDHHE